MSETTVPVVTLVEFLERMLDEAEETARHRDVVTFGGHRHSPEATKFRVFDPDFVLTDIQVKRRILADLAIAEDALTTTAWTDNRIARERMTTCRDVLLAVCRLLALPHAGHPDFNPDWRPDE